MSDIGLQNPNGIDWQNADRTVGTVNYQDRNQTAIFYMDKRVNPAKSADAGCPQFDNIVMVRIGNPGERLNVVIRPATNHDRQRFALQYAQFQQNMEQRPEGTPISLLIPENPAAIGTLEASGVYTVQQLAALSANAIESIGMGCQTWVNAAQNYLKDAEKGINATKIRKMREDHDRAMAAVQQQLAEQAKVIAKLQAQIRQGNVRQAAYDEAGAMERPVHLPQQAFDPQNEMIAATGRAMRPSPKPSRRERVKLRG